MGFIFRENEDVVKYKSALKKSNIRYTCLYLPIVEFLYCVIYIVTVDFRIGNMLFLNNCSENKMYRIKDIPVISVNMWLLS